MCSPKPICNQLCCRSQSLRRLQTPEVGDALLLCPSAPPQRRRRSFAVGDYKSRTRSHEAPASEAEADPELPVQICKAYSAQLDECHMLYRDWLLFSRSKKRCTTRFEFGVHRRVGNGLLEVERVLHSAILSPVYNLCDARHCYGGVQLPFEPPPDGRRLPLPSFYFMFRDASQQCVIPYLSDCYASQMPSKDFVHALLILAQNGLQVMRHCGTVGCVLSLCVRDKLQYAFLEKQENNRCVLHLLTKQLHFDSAEDSAEIVSVSVGLAVWLERLSTPLDAETCGGKDRSS